MCIGIKNYKILRSVSVLLAKSYVGYTILQIVCIAVVGVLYVSALAMGY